LLSEKQIESLGVKGVLNMQDEYAGPHALYKHLDIVQTRLPTIDQFEPSLDNLKKACAYIEQHQKRGELVYVHCKAGYGRAGTVALAWLAYSRGIHDEGDLEALNKELRKTRRVGKRLYDQPNLKAFAAWVQETREDHQTQN